MEKKLLWIAFILGCTTVFGILTYYIAGDLHRIKLALYEDTRVNVIIDHNHKYSCKITNGKIRLENCMQFD